MCLPLVAAVGMAAVSLYAASEQQSTAKKNANAQARATNDAALKQTNADYKQQEATMRYQDETWQQDLDFATQTLDYQKGEFAKQADYVTDSGKAILQNEASQLAQVALQTVQKHIAITLQEADVNTKAAEARATAQVQADARGASGNSVDAIIQDVSRQQGQAIGTMEMNRSAMQQQARTDLEAVKAGADTNLGQLAASVKVYSPSTQIRAPGPVAGVQSPTLVSTPARSGLGDSLAIVGAGVSGAVQGWNGAVSLTGTTNKEAWNGVKGSLGIT